MEDERWKTIELLSELRAGYSCFEEKEEPYYRALSLAIASIREQINSMNALGKIRAEMEQLPTKTRTNWDGCCPDIYHPEIEYVDVTKNKLLSIIDKYNNYIHNSI